MTIMRQFWRWLVRVPGWLWALFAAAMALVWMRAAFRATEREKLRDMREAEIAADAALREQQRVERERALRLMEADKRRDEGLAAVRAEEEHIERAGKDLDETAEALNEMHRRDF